MEQERLAADIREGAKMTSLSPHTLRKYIRLNKLKAVRVGRRILVPIAALRELVSKGC
jgi:excisionase family DNA binding protein